MILSTSGAIFLVCNDTKAQFWIGIRNTITTVAGFLIVVYIWNTIEAKAWAWTITLFVNFVCSYYIMYRYVLHISILPFVKELVKPSIIAAILYALLWVLNQYNYGEWLIVPIVVKGTLSVIAALTLVQIMGLYDLVHIVKTKYYRQPHGSRNSA